MRSSAEWRAARARAAVPAPRRTAQRDLQSAAFLGQSRERPRRSALDRSRRCAPVRSARLSPNRVLGWPSLCSLPQRCHGRQRWQRDLPISRRFVWAVLGSNQDPQLVESRRPSALCRRMPGQRRPALVTPVAAPTRAARVSSLAEPGCLHSACSPKSSAPRDSFCEERRVQSRASRATATASPAVSFRPCSHASAKAPSSSWVRMVASVASFSAAR
jgi:hypothetical protein